MKIKAFLFLLFLNVNAYSQYILKVHFLYGSTPKSQYQDEPKWFGGKLGGHVGIEIDGNGIFNFVPSGGFHVFQKKNEKHSEFAYHSYKRFYEILGGIADSNKKLIIHIPITEKQKQTFDSLSRCYTKETPYDYAFFGMRCGAAGYDVLAHLGIVKQYSYYNTHTRIFFPKKLRKRLIKLAQKNTWKVERIRGSSKRNWEKD